MWNAKHEFPLCLMACDKEMDNFYNLGDENVIFERQVVQTGKYKNFGGQLDNLPQIAAYF